MSLDDDRAAAHVDGYLVGAHGRPCDVPLYESIVLRRAWIRGWQIGRSRMPAPAPLPDVHDEVVVVVSAPTSVHEDP